MYRSLPDSGPACDTHPAAPSRAHCADCDARVCTPCSLYVDLRLVCPRCHKRARLRGAVKRHGGRALVASAFVAAAALMMTRTFEQRADPYHWGRYAASIRALTAKVDAKACDGESLYALGSVMRDAGDLEGATSQLDLAVSICKLPTAVHRLSYELHMQQHQLAAANRDLTRLIALEPNVAKHYFDRGRINDATGEPELAVADYWSALRNDGNYPHAMERIIGIYDALRSARDCAHAEPAPRRDEERPPAPGRPQPGAALARACLALARLGNIGADELAQDGSRARSRDGTCGVARCPITPCTAHCPA